MSELNGNINIEPPQCDEKEAESAVAKSSLSVKKTFAIGLSWIKRCPIKYMFSIILASLGFLLFGFSLTVSMMDLIRAEIQQLYDNGMKTVIIQSENERHYFVRLGHHVDRHKLTERQFEVLSKINTEVKPMKTVHSFIDLRSSLYVPNEHIPIDAENPYESKFSYFEYLVELNPSSGESDARLTPDKRFLDSSLCKLPSNFDEIAISDAHMDMFMRFGYREDSGEKTVISSPDDLIGKKIDGLNVCGVYSTECDKDYYKKYDSTLSESKGEESFLLAMHGSGPPQCAYVYEGFLEHNRKNCGVVTVHLSGNINHDVWQIRKLFSIEGNIVCKIILCSPYSGYYHEVRLISEYAPRLCVPVGLIFTILFLVPILSFFRTIKKWKQNNPDILSSIVTTPLDEFKVRLCCTLIMMLIVYLIAVLLTGIACAVFNSFDQYISAFGLNFPGLISLLVICLGFGALTAFLGDSGGVKQEKLKKKEE